MGYYPSTRPAPCLFVFFVPLSAFVLKTADVASAICRSSAAHPKFPASLRPPRSFVPLR
jgi:hypothetical protein